MKPLEIVERSSLVNGLYRELQLKPAETAIVTVDST